MKKLITILFSSLFGLSACAPTGANYNASSANANNNHHNGVYKPKPNNAMTEKWYLSSIDNRPYQGPRISMQLTSQQRLNGFSGCNRFFATVTELDRTRLRFGSIGGTKMLCTNPTSNRLEHRFLNALGGVRHYQKNNHRLVLDGRTRLVFIKKTARRK